MRAERHGGRHSRLFSFVRRAGLALLTAACLIGAALPASAQTFPNLSGGWNGTRTEVQSGVPSTSNQTLKLFQVTPGGNVTGVITTYWPGINATWSASVSGTISGSTLAINWTVIPGTVQGSSPCSTASLNLTLATSGSVTTATVPTYHPCANPSDTVNSYPITLIGWQKMYGTESAGCANCARVTFSGSVDVATGNVLEPTTDYETAGPNKLSLVRYYNSFHTLARFPAALTYVVPNVPNVTTNYDLGLTINAAGTQVIAYRPDGQQLTFNLVGSTWTPDSDVDMVLTGSGSGTWTLTNLDDSVETYTVTIPGGLPGFGQINSIKTRNGYTQTIAYNGSNQIATVTDSYGRALTFSYSIGGYLTSVTTPDSLVLSYAYSSSTGGANDRIASVSYNTSPATSVTYNYTNSSFPFNITSVTDENGNAFRTFTYDTYGRALTDQTGTGANADVTTITYNDAVGTTTVQNALGQQVTYTYAALQGANKVMQTARTASASVPAATSKFTYDGNGFTATAIDWNGNTTALTNNAHGDPTTIVEASGSAVARTTTIAYDTTFVHLPATITTTGLTTGFTYDGSGNPLTQVLTDTTAQTIPYSTNGQTRTTHFTWSNFLPLTVQTPNGNTTTFTFGTDGALTNIQNALLQNTAITSHTGGGLPLTIVDPNSVTTTLTYSPRNWLLTSTVATGAGNLTTTNTYDAAGNLTKVQQPDGSYLINGFDTAHRLTSVTDSFGNSIDYTLDAMGDRTVSNIENPSAVVTRGHTATYDTLGRVLTDVGGMSQSTAYLYDSNSNVTRFSPPSQFFAYRIDQLNRWNRQQFNTVNGFVTKTLDAHDRVLTAEDQLSHFTNYVYDGFGDVIQVTSPDTGTAVYHYDPDGNLTQKVDALSITTNYTYDALERMLTTAYPADTAENVAFTYDQTGAGFSFGIGRLTSLTDMAGSLTRAYDERGNLTTEKRTSGGTALTTSYTYDAASRVLTITYPDTSLLTYTRDAMGRITAVSDKPSGAGSATTIASSITYEPFGPWAGFTNGNSITETPTWDLDYRLTTLVDTGTAAVQHIGYAYNATNQPNSYTDSLATANNVTGMTFDGMAHINAYTSGANHFQLHYDNSSDTPNGNRTSTNSGFTWTYAAGTDRLATQVTGGVTTTVATNANGNITGFSPGFGSAAVTTLAYNNANRLTSVASTGGTLGAYVYDAFGQRFSKTVGTTATLYQYSGGALLAETTGGTETNYLYLNGRPLAMLTGSTFTWLHDDNLGRPQVATNAAQTVVWKASYFPFGETFSTSGSFTQNLRFPGQYFDAESGFSHNGFRDYVPSIGRYLEADPIGIYDNAGTVNAGMNPYLYVGADPMRTIDPLGLMTKQEAYNYYCVAHRSKVTEWLCRNHPDAVYLGAVFACGPTAECNVQDAARWSIIAALGAGYVFAEEGAAAKGLVPLDKTIAGYSIFGAAGLVGDTYAVSILDLTAANGEGLAALDAAVTQQALDAGASEIVITGLGVSTRLMGVAARLASMLGYDFSQINATTVTLTKLLP